MLQKPKVVVILGATATGKSHCAIEIAKQFQGEIISGDSMLVYKNMNIGTAKPTAEELAAVPHHLVDILPPDASFSVVDFKERAAALITEINARGHLPIIAGGTGLYIKALLEDYAFNNADEDSELRRRLEAEAQEKGALALHARCRSWRRRRQSAFIPIMCVVLSVRWNRLCRARLLTSTARRKVLMTL